jgi:pilus assembly protein TadC
MRGARLYRTLSKIMPGKWKRSIKSLLNYADSKEPVDVWVGKYVFRGLIFGGLTAFILFYFLALDILIILGAFIAIFIMLQVIPRVVLDMSVSKRATFVEKILPDALLLISSNMRSGLTPDRAIMLSAREEFGPLEKEIREVAKKAMSGVPLDEALEHIKHNIRSKMLERTISLLVEGIKSGGEFATLLEGIALDIRDLSILQSEVRASVTMYGIFILMASAFGAPLLFGVSTYLITQITEITSSIDIPAEATATLAFSINFGPPPVSPEFLMIFATISILMTTTFASLIMGLIRTGSEKDGIKFIPILIVIGLVIFFVTRIVMESVIAAGGLF